MKIPKLVARDLAAQAAMTDALNSEQGITEAARAVRAATPMLDAGKRRYARAVERCDGALDMMAVLRVLEDGDRC
jgi:3-hydroxyisobutyrate dehydrogenase